MTKRDRLIWRATKSTPRFGWKITGKSRGNESDMKKCVLVVLASLLGISSAPGAGLRIGAAAVNITPPIGIGLAGYYFERGAQGTNDDLFAKTIVLEKDGQYAAVLGLDLISTTRSMVEA